MTPRHYDKPKNYLATNYATIYIAIHDANTYLIHAPVPELEDAQSQGHTNPRVVGLPGFHRPEQVHEITRRFSTGLVQAVPSSFRSGGVRVAVDQTLVAAHFAEG